MAEWLKAADCKSALIEYAGSNPALPTIIFKQSVHHHGERFFIMAGLGSNHCRIRPSGEAKGLSRSEAESGECKAFSNPALPTILRFRFGSFEWQTILKALSPLTSIHGFFPRLFIWVKLAKNPFTKDGQIGLRMIRNAKSKFTSIGPS